MHLYFFLIYQDGIIRLNVSYYLKECRRKFDNKGNLQGSFTIRNFLFHFVPYFSGMNIGYFLQVANHGPEPVCSESECNLLNGVNISEHIYLSMPMSLS